MFRFGDPLSVPGDHGPTADGDDPHAVLTGLLACIDADAAAGQAAQLIALYGSLGGILAVSAERLRTLVGQPAARLIVAHKAVALATLRDAAVRGPIVPPGAELLCYLQAALAHEQRELCLAIFLNARHEVLAQDVIVRGGLNGMAVEPRDVLVRALDIGATGMVIVHNHPSGDPDPSPADRRFTSRLARACDSLDIILHDHLVIARDSWARVPVIKT